eukprot:1159267-Pelagomonas_calceolata.AAC.4
MGRHAHAYAHSEERYQLAALGLPLAPLTNPLESSSSSPAHQQGSPLSSSSSSSSKKAVSPSSAHSTTSAPPPVLSPAEVVPEDCFAELERQSSRRAVMTVVVLSSDRCAGLQEEATCRKARLLGMRCAGQQVLVSSDRLAASRRKPPVRSSMAARLSCKDAVMNEVFVV